VWNAEIKNQKIISALGHFIFVFLKGKRCEVAVNRVLNVEQKKGDPARLDGQVTVYAVIDIDPAELMSMKHPIVSMVHGGLLVAVGNYREQNSLRDFLRSEMGISLEEEGLGEGLADMIDKMEGLESALDPQKLRERLENMGELEEFIPTPAKVVSFHSEQELLSQPGDVFFTGTFKKIGNAVLSVNAVPVVYQAVFREQQTETVRSEIESLIAQIERSEPSSKTISSVGINVEEILSKEYIPSMLYQRGNAPEFASAVKGFRAFMSGYRFRDDVEAVLNLISKNEELDAADLKLLELYTKKITLVQSEDFAGVEAVVKEIERFKES
jgi:hypothetical protein